MRTLKKHLSIVIPIIVVIIAVDQITKVWARNVLKGAEPIHFPGDLFILQYAENRGAFLSMGNALPEYLWMPIFVGIPLLFMIWLTWYLIKHRELSLTETIIYSGVVAGGLGNIYDRIVFGFVTDFMNFGIGQSFRTGILNVADMPITLGVIYLVFYYAIRDRARKKKEAAL